MSKIDDGGSCTPDMVSHRPQPDNTVIEDRITMIGGLKLRDYFAAAALQAIISKLPEDEISGIIHGRIRVYGTSKGAYMLADAMLAARKEVQP